MMDHLIAQMASPSDTNFWRKLANGEQQHYTDRLDNSYVSDGTLKIVAKKEQYIFRGITKNYTSARLNSKYAFKYGRVDIRAKLPSEKGTWPAFWTLGANINEIGNYFGSTYGNVGWPLLCGEIDIMEQNGWNKNNLIGHIHWGDTNTGDYGNNGNNIQIQNASSEFNLYSLVWTENSIRILLIINLFLKLILLLECLTIICIIYYLILLWAEI